MKVSIILLQLLLSFTVILIPICFALSESSTPVARDVTIVKPKNKNHTLILIISQGKLINRRNKFPIIPPRLKIRTTTKPSVSTTTVSTTTETTTKPSTTTTTTRRAILRFNNTSAFLRKMDIFEQSSSDNSPSIAWPVPRRPATNRRMWTSASNQASSISEEDRQRRPVPKLLLPRPTRPAMYSLDGFVPKPSIIRITTTEAPPHIKARYASIVAQKTNKRKGYGRQSLDENEESDYKFQKRTQATRNKPVSRYTAFKRKGTPGKDYPVFSSIPATDFDCSFKPGPGMYADPEAGCQVWHMCPGNAPHRYSFMCPNGTIFNENRGVCDWWYNVSCVKLETPLPSSSNTFRRRFGRSFY